MVLAVKDPASISANLQFMLIVQVLVSDDRLV